MYLVAQRVLRPQTGEEGINAFHYVHGGGDWVFPPDPEDDPGELINSNVLIPVGGNRVRSYLDVVAPDAAPWGEVRRGVSVFVLDHFDGPMPWVGRTGRLRFRLAMEDSLARNWRQELTSLLRAAEDVRL
jgi:hypothetical protein